MRKKILKKTLVMSLAMAVSLSCFTGCGKGKSDSASETDASARNVSELQAKVDNGEDLSLEEQLAYDGSLENMISGDLPAGWTYNPSDVKAYEENLAKVNFSDTGIGRDLKISFDGVDLSYPIDYKVFSNNGWHISDDSYMNDKAKEEDYVDIAYLVNDDFPGYTIQCFSHHDGESMGILGRESVLSDVGVYNVSFVKGDSSTNNIDLSINSVDIFNSDSDEIAKAFPSDKYDIMYTDENMENSTLVYEVNDAEADTVFDIWVYFENDKPVRVDMFMFLKNTDEN